MVVIWGTTHAGKVDEVPGGMFHVVTRFGHLYYIPLIPTASFLVLEKTTDGGFHGAEIPFSFKSALAGWLRGFSVVATIIVAFWLLIVAIDRNQGPLAFAPPVLIGLTAIAVLVLTYKLKFFTEANYERAMELAQLVGFNDTVTLMIAVTYGRMSAAEAEAELARREQTQAAMVVEPDQPLAYPPLGSPPAGTYPT